MPNALLDYILHNQMIHSRAFKLVVGVAGASAAMLALVAWLPHSRSNGTPQAHHPPRSTGAHPAAARQHRAARLVAALPPPPVSQALVIVHVAGMVQHPAVYQLAPDARVVDAVRMAGGASAGADLDAVNLAAHLQDGEQIYVPSKAAVVTGSILQQHPPLGRAPLAGPVAEDRTHRARGAGRSSRTTKLKDPSEGSVDLNTAPAEELVRLPGVGPSTAQKILDFRKTKGSFTSLEDVMNVKGIGPAKFAKMKPFLHL